MTEALMNAIRDLLAARLSTYKARNGREMGIEDSSDEKCWIVPFDDMARLEAEYDAVCKLPAPPVDAMGDERGK